MPAKNPRLTITLQPSLAAQLRKLSELTGNSQSALIGDLLEGTGPVFDRMIQVLEAAKSAKESIRGKLADDMEHAQAKMEGALGLVLEGFDEFTGSLLIFCLFTDTKSLKNIFIYNKAQTFTSSGFAFPQKICIFAENFFKYGKDTNKI